MKRSTPHRRPKGANAAIPPHPAEADGPTTRSIVRRADGFYWVSAEERHEFGPYPTLAAVQAASERVDDALLEEGESLEEAESEIGIANWIDPETGEPAESTTLPRSPDSR